MENTILATILQESVLLFLIIGSIFALLLGLLLILSPQQANALSQRYNHWVSLRRPSKPLEALHETNHFFYRHHRATGLFILISTIYILYHFAFNYDQTIAIRALSNHFDNIMIIEWLLNASLWFILPVSMLLLVFGAIMAIKPSSLKGIERFANHWVSTRKLLQPIDKQYKPLDKWVGMQPRSFGILLIFASGYNLIIFLMFLFNKTN